MGSETDTASRLTCTELIELGHAHRAAGRREDCVSAYREAARLCPESGLAWALLVDFKTEPFSDQDVDLMLDALRRAEPADRISIHFALGRAFDDRSDYAAAWRHFSEANRVRNVDAVYDPSRTTAFVERIRANRTAEFFEARRGEGCHDTGPIFIVGMPRSGSTLLEQMLGCHQSIEAMGELQILPKVKDTGGSAGRPGFRRIGEQYLEQVARLRSTDKSYFTDKYPANWRNVTVIQLCLPNAKIIDIRRNALDCCVSNFKQRYESGAHFTDSLTAMGRYYRDYVDFMDHVDVVLPGRVHRVAYEALVEEPEKELRSLFAYLGLDFDPACLAFHELDRHVRTPSADQVRRPLNRDGIGLWRNYEPWIGELRETLGELAV